MPAAKKGRQQTRAGQTRSIGSFGREGGSRSSDRILIVCEGEKTERIYFEAMRGAYKLRAVDVEVVGVGGAPITAVDRALELRAEQRRGSRGSGEAPFDAVWCVFDTEIPHENPSLPPAIDKARANGLSLAISNPSFEFWYLLHFVFTTKSFHKSDEVCDDLRAHIAGYVKTRSYWDQLSPRTDTAIEHAKRISAATEPYPQPSTTAHQLVEVLLGMRRW